MTDRAAAILLGRKGSEGFPGKNTHPVLGRPLAWYALRAASEALGPEACFLSTDDEALKRIAWDLGMGVIERPEELATREALGEDAFAHAWSVVRAILRVDILALMFCNAPTVTPGIIRQGIRILNRNRVSRYNMWSPPRARRIGEDGLLHPFVPLRVFGDALTCDRDSQGDVWFADMGVSVVRPRCLEKMAEGIPPQRWMGRRIYPLAQEGGLDVDFAWQIPYVERWLKERGFDEDAAHHPAHPRLDPQ